MSFITAIIFGILSASFALAIELLTGVSFGTSSQTTSVLSLGAFSVLLGIAGIEELSKFIFLRQYAKNFLLGLSSITALHSIVLGVFFGLGFASLEITLMWYNGVQLVLWPFLGAAGLHIATSMGFATFIFTPYQKAISSRIIIIALAIFLHIAYNMFALYF